MSDSNVDPAVIKRTQEILGKFVKKPALTDKLLNKPPFRFLHDITTSIIKETGFLNGLYTKEELVSDNVKDRDAKIKFLQKLIDVIKSTTNEKVLAKPSKIIAGHEANNTNQLLQLVGIAIEKKFDCSQAIENVKKNDGIKPKISSKEKVKSTNDKSKSNAKSVNKVESQNNKKESKITTAAIQNEKPSTKTDTKSPSNTKEKEKEKTKVSSTKVKKTEKPVKSTKVEKKGSDTKQSTTKKVVPNVNDVPKKIPSEQNSIDLSSLTSNAVKDIEPQKKSNEIEKEPIPIPLPASHDKPAEIESLPISSEKGGTITSQDDANNNIERVTEPKPIITERRKSSGSRRPSVAEESISAAEVDRSKSSAKKNRSKATSSDKPPKINEANVQNTQEPPPTTEVKRQSTFLREAQEVVPRPRTSLRPPSVRPASARPGAPRRRDKNVEIILQPNDQVKLAGINVKVDNFDTQLDDDGENLVIIENIGTEDTTTGKDQNETILDDEAQQGHLVQQILQTQKELTQGDGDSGIDTEWDVATIQNRQSSAKQMDSLRDVIQNLTRSINPLGKLMDFLPEDIDSMQLELTMWRDVYIQASSELKKEKSLTETAIEPMKNQLAQLDSSIKEYTDMIDASRAKILQNSEKIFKLLTDQ